jgi:putative component of toxin-antitoxin plasmid stabilization module
MPKLKLTAVIARHLWFAEPRFFRNPHYLRDGIYELRASYHGIHYRMLYFFHGKAAAVLSHGVIKEQRVPAKDIDRAKQRRYGESGLAEKVPHQPQCLSGWSLLVYVCRRVPGPCAANARVIEQKGESPETQQTPGARSRQSAIRDKA